MLWLSHGTMWTTEEEEADTWTQYGIWKQDFDEFV